VEQHYLGVVGSTELYILYRGLTCRTTCVPLWRWAIMAKHCAAWGCIKHSTTSWI